jgi:transcription initiation factor TFIIA large subunit
MATPSQFTVGKLYQNVIEDVVSNVRDTFLDEGVDEQVLSELRMLWESKLMNSKAVENGSYGGEASLANNGSGSSKSSTSRQAGQSSSAPTIRTDVNTVVPIQITMPRQPGDASDVQKTITVLVPASCIHNNKLQAILSNQKVQEILCSGAANAAKLLQDEVNKALQEGGSEPATTGSRNNRRSHPMHDFVQADGQTTNGDSSEEDDEDELDDDDLDDDFDDKDDDKDDEPEDEGQDEEPLNSGDDVSGDEDTNENIYEVDNVVVCQYDKITRARNKWKFHFKDGIMNLNGKDYVFQKANGDAEW